jgi:hypothetical protein
MPTQIFLSCPSIPVFKTKFFVFLILFNPPYDLNTILF